MKKSDQLTLKEHGRLYDNMAKKTKVSDHEKEIEERRVYYPPYPHEAKMIADMWNAYLGIHDIKDVDVPQMMILLKMSRIKLGKFHKDNYVDQRGYSQLSEEFDKAGTVTGVRDGHGAAPGTRRPG